MTKKKSHPGVTDNKEQYEIKSNQNAEFKCRMKEVTQPRAGNPAEAELGRRYVGSACALGWLQAEGFPTSAACSASGGFMSAAQHFLHAFFFTS